MDVNERIARALGWKQCEKTNCLLAPRLGVCGEWFEPGDPHHWTRRTLPDYAHSLDACLPVLADKEQDGWQWQVGGAVYPREGSNTETDFKFWAVIMVPGRRDIARYGQADSPAAALAECLADALEAEKRTAD